MGWEDAPVATAQTDVAAVGWESAPRYEPDLSSVRRQFEPFSLRPRGQIATLAGKASSEQPKSDQSFTEALEAGLQMSVTGLIARGKAPSVDLKPNPNFAARIGSNIGTFVGDSPAMLGGAILGGGPASPVTATAGAFGLPAGLRATLMDGYTKGEFKGFSDFWDRASGIIWETIKGEITGAATAGSGIVTRAALPTAPAVTRVLAPTAAEVATMTSVGHALEGEIPSAQDFLDAGVVIFGMKAAGAGAAKLRSIYAKTGIPPEQVVADAAGDPALKEELVKTFDPNLETGWTGAPSKESMLRSVGDIPMPGHMELPKAYQPLADVETARSIVPGVKASEVAASPFAEIPQAKGEPAKPTHVNYNYLNSTEDAKGALARLSQVYEQEIQTQRRGTVAWEETSTEATKLLSDTLGGVDARLLMPREPGTPAGAAEILARKQLTIGAAEDMMRARDDLLAKGAEATPEDRLTFLASIERASLIQAEFLGARAEAGRALNILKSTAMDADRVKLIQQVIDQYGGKDPVLLAQMLKGIDTASGALKFAREATKATLWEKIIEAWKASILSGPVTHTANIMGNATFAFLRAPVDAVAAGIGSLRGGADRVTPVEPLARLIGVVQGTLDGLKLGWYVLKTGEQPGKAETFRKAIGGDVDSTKTAQAAGEVVRLPFRFLSAEDAIFTTMNERGEAYSLAVRQATKEGMNPLTHEFRERVVQLVQEPTIEMAKAIEGAGKRFTFNTELGEKGQAVQKFVRAWHLEWAVPFIRTPGNIAKELARMTPLAPLVKEWREAIVKGGAERDKAIAEIAVGTATMTAVFAYAMEGNISGAGEPDPGKRRVQQAAGLQPYSIKFGNTWYNYQRLQPFGTLVGMAADIAEVWDHLNEEESDKVPKMLSVAFANAVTNQTFLQGITNVVNAMGDPTRFGPRFVQQYAASTVPAIIGQTTQMFDPVVREVDSVLDAVKARVPGLRQTLMTKRDIFGEPQQQKERLAGISPIQESAESTDKVRTEAARLGLSVADTPKKTHIGRLSGKMGDVKLEPEERDRFADVGGHLAYQLLQPIVNGENWEGLSDLAKKRVFERVFAQAHRAAALQAMDPEKRIGLALEISEKVMQSLQPEKVEP